MDRERLSYVEIRDRRDRELVTVVELLSPANKHPGPIASNTWPSGWSCSTGRFIWSRSICCAGALPCRQPAGPTARYSVLVSRAERRLDAEFWPISLRERLPLIPIPVRAPDADARLDLQEVLHRIYDDAGYADYIYEGAPRPRLGRRRRGSGLASSCSQPPS